MVAYEDVQAYIHAALERALERADGLVFMEAPGAVDNQTLSTLHTKQQQLTAQIERLLSEQSLAADGLQSHYRTMLSRLAEEQSTVQERITALEQAQQKAQSSQYSRTAALDDVRAIGLDSFWQQPDMKINQVLHRLFGLKRLVVLNGRVVRTADGSRQRHQ